MNMLSLLKIVQITIYTFLLTNCVIEINAAAFIGSWLGLLYPTSKLKQDGPSVNTTLPSKCHGISNYNEPSIVPKYELEDEYHPEETTPKTTSQEIDETNPDATCICPTKSSSADFEIENETSHGVELEEKGTSTNIVKPEPIVITSTIIELATKYTTVFPSCLKFDRVSRICDDTLITVEPTAAFSDNFLLRGSSIAYEVTESVDEHPSSVSTTARVRPSETRYYTNVIAEPSDYDYEFESLQFSYDGNKIRAHAATPELRRVDDTVKENRPARKSNYFLEQEYIIQSKVISITKTMTATDIKKTATIVVSNCIPRNIQIPQCTLESNKSFKIPQFPLKTYPRCTCTETGNSNYEI